jgi:predicted transcriptional regulator
MTQREAVKIVNSILEGKSENISRETKIMVEGAARTMVVLLYREGYEVVKKGVKINED